MDFGGLFDKAKEFATKNPEQIREGLGKVEGVVNEHTDGKYAEHLAKGIGAVEDALGVPGQTKKAFTDEMGHPEGTSPVTVDPVDAPSKIRPPEKI